MRQQIMVGLSFIDTNIDMVLLQFQNRLWQMVFQGRMFRVFDLGKESREGRDFPTRKLLYILLLVRVFGRHSLSVCVIRLCYGLCGTRLRMLLYIISGFCSDRCTCLSAASSPRCCLTIQASRCISRSWDTLIGVCWNSQGKRLTLSQSLGRIAGEVSDRRLVRWSSCSGISISGTTLRKLFFRRYCSVVMADIFWSKRALRDRRMSPSAAISASFRLRQSRLRSKRAFFASTSPISLFMALQLVLRLNLLRKTSLGTHTSLAVIEAASPLLRKFPSHKYSYRPTHSPSPRCTPTACPLPLGKLSLIFPPSTQPMASTSSPNA